MTAASQERLLTQLQSKASPTVQSSHPEVIASKASASSRPASRVRVAKPRQDALSADFTSRSATLSLIRRTLIKDTSQSNDPRTSPKPIEGILPPLTSSNEIDLQLYAIVAIVVKDFVNTWYSKITQEQSFVEEIVQIIAHCSRALEERIRHIDVAELLLDELPILLERHVTAYRTATSSWAKQYYDVNPRTIYHNLNPHPALESEPDSDQNAIPPVPSESEIAYRQLLIQGTLAILLPTEDLQNAPLRILVSDIIADLIIGQAVAEKVCEGWFLATAVTKVITALKNTNASDASTEPSHQDSKTRLEKFGLLNTGHNTEASHPSSSQSSIAILFWRAMHWSYLGVTAVWFITQGIFYARHLPNRTRPAPSTGGSLKTSPAIPTSHKSDQSPRAVLAYSITSFCSTLIRLNDRMPWLRSAFVFCQHVLLAGSGQLATTNSVLDRFLYQLLTSFVFTPDVVTSILVGLRIGVFPNNSLGPPAPPPPSPEERVEIQRQAAKAITGLLPAVVMRAYFDTDDEAEILEHVERDILDVFGDKYMNKHLVYGVLELFLVRLVPELQEAGVGDLLAERGVSWGEVGVELEDHAKATGKTEKPPDEIAGLGM